MKRLMIAFALASLLLLCSCQTAKDMAYAGQASSMAAETSQEIRNTIDNEIARKLMESSETFTIEKYEISTDRPTTVMAAVRNSKSTDAIFRITADCRSRNIMPPVTVSVGAGESKAFELEVNTVGLEKREYFCTLTASSNLGEESSKAVTIHMR